jgi:hypothetical protein
MKILIILALAVVGFAQPNGTYHKVPTEKFNVAVDFSAAFGVTDTLSITAYKVTDDGNGQIVTSAMVSTSPTPPQISHSVTINGSTATCVCAVAQIMAGTDGHTYLFDVTVLDSTTNETRDGTVRIIVKSGL